MKGIELSERFFLEHGAPMLREQFPQIEPFFAVGLVGSGSECFGYDDEISQDHDFEAGFCIFLPDEETVSRRVAFELERAYSRLPREFMGYKRSIVDPVGGNRHGVMRISDFFKQKTGKADGVLDLKDWFFVPEQSLAEATNGKVFFDGYGELTRIRKALSYMPEDVRLKKLAGNLLIMGQSGQYNYSRCVARGERAAAQLAVGEFVRSALNVIFLINRRYTPYYKWAFRALSEVGVLSELYEPLEKLISSGNADEEYVRKTQIIEAVCDAISDALRAQGLITSNVKELEAHAYEVNNAIMDGEIRNLHILYAI